MEFLVKVFLLIWYKLLSMCYKKNLKKKKYFIKCIQYMKSLGIYGIMLCFNRSSPCAQTPHS